MIPADKLRMVWIDKHLVTVYGPYRCYSVWEAIGGAVCVFILTIILWMCG